MGRRFRRGLRRRRGPTRIAARLTQFIFEIGNVRFVFRDRGGLIVDLRLRIVQVLAGIFLLELSHWVSIILLLLQVIFALQNVEFVFIVRELLVSIGEFLPPVFFILGRLAGLRPLLLAPLFLGLLFGRGGLLTHDVDSAGQ